MNQYPFQRIWPIVGCLGVFLSLLFVAEYSSASTERERILVVRGESNFFLDAMEGIRSEMGEDYEINDFAINKKTKYREFEARVQSEGPALLMVMDNRAVTFARKFLRQGGGQPRYAVASMALNLKKILRNDEQICGVAYETPALSLLVGFRDLTVDYPLRTVMTLYRGSQHREIIDDAKRQLRREGMRLVAIDAEKSGRKKEEVTEYVQGNLSELIKKHKPDVFWLLADNYLLNKKTYNETWRKVAMEDSVPFVCDIEKFVHSDSDLCVYAHTPALERLGEQMAQLGFELLEDDMTPAEVGVDYVVSSKRVVNLSKMRRLRIDIDYSKLSGATLFR